MNTRVRDHGILIVDFGSQYTQLIARRVRELGIFCEIHPFDITNKQLVTLSPKGVILHGSNSNDPLKKVKLNIYYSQVNN